MNAASELPAMIHSCTFGPEAFFEMEHRWPMSAEERSTQKFRCRSAFLINENGKTIGGFLLRHSFFYTPESFASFAPPKLSSDLARFTCRYSSPESRIREMGDEVVSKIWFRTGLIVLRFVDDPSFWTIDVLRVGLFPHFVQEKYVPVGGALGCMVMAEASLAAKIPGVDWFTPTLELKSDTVGSLPPAWRFLSWKIAFLLP